jgi:PKHD-type hydroxylase
MFRIKPYPALVDPTVRVTKGATDEQADQIRALCDEYLTTKPEVGTVGFNEYRHDPDRRICTVSWLPFPEADSRTGWVYTLCADVAQQANATFWQFDLTGFYDKLHCLSYGPNGHFEWHRDSGDNSLRPQRKLSFSIMLSDPDEYEGGDLQIFDGSPTTVNAKAKGTFIVFPSWVQHRVTPVTKGERKSLVGWIGGPKLR